jgi:hypothetical protein
MGYFNNMSRLNPKNKTIEISFLKKNIHKKAGRDLRCKAKRNFKQFLKFVTFYIAIINIIIGI